MPAMVGTPSLEWALALTGSQPRGGRRTPCCVVPRGRGGPVVLPFFAPAGERAPFVDPAARGQFLGVSLESTRADVVRAVCEGIAYTVRHCLESAGLGADAQVLLSGGGVRSAQWRQILADVLQRPLALARQPEPGARGAAMAALMAAGRHVDVDTWTRPDASVEPRRISPVSTMRGSPIIVTVSRLRVAGGADRLSATLICVCRHGDNLARQVIDAGQKRVIVAKAPRLRRDRAAMEAPSIESARGYPR